MTAARLCALALALLLCGGCTAHAPEQLALLSALALDGAQGCSLTAELAVPGETREQIAPRLVRGEGDALGPALRALGTAAGRPLWSGHASVAVWGRESAASGAPARLDALCAQGLPQTALLAVADGEGAALLDKPPAEASLAGEGLASLLRDGARRGESVSLTLGALRAALAAHAGAAAPLLALREGEAAVDGAALLCEGALCGTLTRAQTGALRVLCGQSPALLPLAGGDCLLGSVRRTVRAEGEGAAHLSLRLSVRPLDGAPMPTKEELCAALRAVLTLLQQARCDAIGLGAALGREDAGWPDDFSACALTLELTLHAEGEAAHG